MASKRFEILDFYRFLAILMVMFYHYFSRWSIGHNNIDLYPYENKYDMFLWGRMGVQFFFIISGFVIYMTLERAISILDFAKKRFVRLWPSMVLMSTITFIVFLLFDTKYIFKDSHEIGNLFYSWSFLGKTMSQGNYTYIDGSYWSLWVEIQFYFLSAVLYFILKKAKTIHLFPFFLFIMAIIGCFLKPKMAYFNEIFNLFLYFNFFVIGVVFKELFRSQHPWSLRNWHWHFIIFALLILEWIYFADDGYSKMLDLVFVLAFYLFIYLSQIQWSSSNRIFTTLVFWGEASYISYLMHQNIGVLIINKIGYSGKLDFVVPISVMILMFTISTVLYSQFEKPVMDFLKKRIFKASV